MKKTWLLMAAVAIPLVTAGCFGGSGGLFSLFGEGGASDILSAFGSSSGGSGGDVASTTSTGGSGGGTGGTISVATVHNPEPASLGLFAGGLASLALSRRRKARKVSK